jgi:DNA-binding transcriptional ArsR family regulator
LTLDGAEVPHLDVVKGSSDSRVLRRPVEFETAEFMAGHISDEDASEFVERLIEVWDRAQIAPGDAFYVSRLPKPDPPAAPARKPSKCPQGLPRSTSQRGRVLGRILRAPLGVTRDIVVEWALVEGVPLTSANRRLQELTEAGLVRETDEGRLVLTKRCTDLLDEEAER